MYRRTHNSSLKHDIEKNSTAHGRSSSKYLVRQNNCASRGEKKGVLIYLMFIFLVVFLLDERTCSILVTVLINKINYKEH